MECVKIICDEIIVADGRAYFETEKLILLPWKFGKIKIFKKWERIGLVSSYFEQNGVCIYKILHNKLNIDIT